MFIDKKLFPNFIFDIFKFLYKKNIEINAQILHFQVILFRNQYFIYKKKNLKLQIAINSPESQT